MAASFSIINKGYEVYKSITLMNDALSKRWRYSLGLSLENSFLESIDCLIMAKNAPKPLRGSYLIKASAKLESSLLKLRLLLELKLANETKVFQTQNAMEEMGRMLGGWLKAA